MAGKLHHYIPQFLQRGFASHCHGEKTYTWVHRKGREPFNSNIENIGAEGYFYTLNGNTALDDAITTYENELSELVKDLREGRVSTIAAHDSIAELLAHLEIRTRHLRQSVLTTTTEVTDAIMARLGDVDVRASFIMRAFEADPSILTNALERQFIRAGIPVSKVPEVLQQLQPHMGELLKKGVPEMNGFVIELRNRLPSMIVGALKSSHLEAMHRSLAPPPRVRRFADLNFRIQEFPNAHVPLGDAPVIYHLAGSSKFRPFNDETEKLAAVLLPIDDSRVLLGSSSEYGVELSSLKTAIARCSLEHFITSEAPPAGIDLDTQIGQDAGMTSSDEIGILVQEFLA